MPALLWAAPALGQPPATKDPRVTGPLYLAGMSCGDEKLKHEGEMLAKVASCIRLYEYDSLSEVDPTVTYGIAWVQTTVDPVNGWCATKVRSEVLLPNNVSRYSHAPTRKMTPNGRESVTVNLRSDAQKFGLSQGIVRQTIDVYPDSIESSFVRDGRVFRTQWRGEESRELAFVSAVEIGWQMLEAPQIRGGLGRMGFIKSPGC